MSMTAAESQSYQQGRLDEAREGKCRFNCRTNKEAFFAGCDYISEYYGEGFLSTPLREEAYSEWKRRQA